MEIKKEINIFIRSKIQIGIFCLAGAVMGLIYIVFFSKLQHISYDQALSEVWYIILITMFLGWLSGNVFVAHEVVDINFSGEYPSYPLSNLYQCPFYFDGVYCATREGLLQAFKTKVINEQVRLCTLSGHNAQKAGQEYNNWKDNQILYWNGKSFERDSDEYLDLLKQVFNPENMSLDIIVALLATNNRKLIHSVGKSDMIDTVLTEQEFCSLMTSARIKLKEKGLAYIG